MNDYINYTSNYPNYGHHQPSNAYTGSLFILAVKKFG
jgi:hypothetical protein